MSLPPFGIYATDVYSIMGKNPYKSCHFAFERSLKRWASNHPPLQDNSIRWSTHSSSPNPKASPSSQTLEIERQCHIDSAVYQKISLNIEDASLRRWVEVNKQQQQPLNAIPPLSFCPEDRAQQNFDWGIKLESYIRFWYKQSMLHTVPIYRVENSDSNIRCFSSDERYVQNMAMPWPSTIIDVIEDEDREYLKPMPPIPVSPVGTSKESDLHWFLAGRIDGHQFHRSPDDSEDCMSIIEIKNRRRNECYSKWLHVDYLQAQTYLHLRQQECKQAFLIDSVVKGTRKGDENVEVQMNILRTQKNHTFWSQFMWPRLSALVIVANLIARDDEARKAYFSANPNSNERENYFNSILDFYSRKISSSTFRQ